MENKNQKLDEQEAPLKNTDNAFVQVSKDGSPHIPENDNDDKREDQEKDAPGFADR